MLREINHPHLPAAGNPIDRALNAVRPDPVRKGILLLFNAPIAVTIGTVVVLTGPAEPRVATTALGVATAGVAMLALITAVLRTLALGEAADHTSEIDLSDVAPFRNWAGVRHRGSNEARTVNVFVYFFVLLYMSALGFGALYCAIQLASHDAAFSTQSVVVSQLSWLYFSITTLATVGFGDLHAQSTEAQIAVACQIVSGPLIVGWFLAALPHRAPDPGPVLRYRTRRSSASNGSAAHVGRRHRDPRP